MPCKPLYRLTHALYSHNFALEGAIFALEAPYLLFALLLMWVNRPNAFWFVIVKSVVWLIYARFFLTLSGSRLKWPNGTS